MLLTTSQSVSGPTSRSPSSHFCSASKRLWKRQQLRPVAAPLGTSRSPAWGNKRASAMRWRASSPCCLRLADLPTEATQAFGIWPKAAHR